jgi:hypothetical protein
MLNTRHTQTQDIILSNIAPLLENDRKRNVSTVRKIAVFDMDETLGIFSEFGEFIHILTSILNARRGRGNPADSSDSDSSSGSEDNDGNSLGTTLINKHFTQIMDLYPELLRPKILDVMRFLSRMKRVKRCSNVMIYTNNTGPISWANNIKNFFNAKARYEVFDKVIGAFRRPNGEIVEVKRTTHDKTYADLVRCTNMMGKFEVFFIDDRKHPGMHAENVYVIRVKPYSRHIPMQQFITRFKNSRIFHSLNFRTEEFDKYLARAANERGRRYTDEEREVDDVIGTTILEKLREFFGGGANGGDDGGQEPRGRAATTTANARSGRARANARSTRRRMQ